METIMFTFGVLSVVTIIFVIIIILGIVKVLKLNKQVTQLHSLIENQERWGYNQILEISRSVDEINSNIHHRITEVETECKIHSTSYTDKRIDKLIDTYFNIKQIKK